MINYNPIAGDFKPISGNVSIEKSIPTEPRKNIGAEEERRFFRCQLFAVSRLFSFIPFFDENYKIAT